MAGETALSSASSTGVYLLKDNNSWVSNNTPNTCNLGGDTGLVLGTGYIYFEDFITLQEAASTPDNDNNSGWEFMQNGTYLLRQEGIAGQGVVRIFVLTVHVDSTEQGNFLKFFEVNQLRDANASSYQCYLVRQWASTTFKQFVYNASLKNYAAVCITGYQLVENKNEGKDVQTLQISMNHAYRVDPTG